MDSTVIYPRTDRWVYAGSDPDDPKGKSGDEEHLTGQIADLQEINATNVRIKAAMEQQLIGHQDSIGKNLPDYIQAGTADAGGGTFCGRGNDERTVATEDVLYTVPETEYARLFSASSKRARSLGNSIRYREMPDIYQELAERRVYINKAMLRSIRLWQLLFTRKKKSG